MGLEKVSLGRLSMNEETGALECWAGTRAQGSSEASEYMGSLWTKALMEESLHQPHKLPYTYLPLAEQGQVVNVTEPDHHPLVDGTSLGPNPNYPVLLYSFFICALNIHIYKLHHQITSKSHPAFSAWYYSE